MTFVGTFTEPYYEGSAAVADVPGTFDVALAGRGFMLSGDPWGHVSIPMQREQADTSDTPGEQTVNRLGLWRISQDSWHKGAGQERFDGTDSDPARFRASKGVDPWTKRRLTLLKDTTRVLSSANTNIFGAPTTTRLFVTDGTAVRYTDDLSTFSAMTGTPGTAWKAITTDGYYVYATDGTDIYRWLRSDTAVGASWNQGNVDVLAWIRGKGRLMAALNTGGTRSVYNVTAGGATAGTDIAPSVITPDFTWVGFAEGPSVIYGAGYQGDKSLIFRWGIKSDGTGLDAAVPALSDGLPDGEIVRSIHGYLGYVEIGTDRGVRFAQPDDAGNLNVGALIETDNPVRCFEGQGRFVWYGLSNYDGVSTGLGRLDMTVLNESAPAWASDLMATTQGDVLSVGTFLDRRVFTVSGHGLVAEHATQLVSDGTVDSGLISAGIADDKIAMFLDVRHRPLGGSHRAWLSANEGTFEDLGSHSTADSTADTFAAQTRGEVFEVRHQLTRSSSDVSQAPVFTRQTLRVNPAAEAGKFINATLRLSTWEERRNSPESVWRDVDGDRAFIELLREDQSAVTWQEPAGTWTVTVDDFEWVADTRVATDAGVVWDGNMRLRLKEVS